MADNATAFSNTTGSAQAAGRSPGPHWLRDTNREVEHESASLQTMFEFDPVSNKMCWADKEVAAKLLDCDDGEPVKTIEALNACVLGDGTAPRTSALSGETQNYVCEYQLKNRTTESHWVEERGGWIGTGPSRRLISVIRSIEAEKRRTDRLAYLAVNDELTGQLNRTSIRERLDETINTLRLEKRHGAYLLAGIDDLAEINAGFGFDVADSAIVDIAQRLQSLLGEHDFIGRVAGTKFGIVLSSCDEKQLRDRCVKLLNVVRELSLIHI